MKRRILVAVIKQQHLSVTVDCYVEGFNLLCVLCIRRLRWTGPVVWSFW